MKKQFEDFQKLKLKDACKTIEQMTYEYINPETKEPTVVPAKHYENILSKPIEQYISDVLKVELLNTIYKQVKMIQDEYEVDFFKSLICMDLGIKPTDMTIPQQIALSGTYEYLQSKKSKEKKKFHFLNEDIIEKFKELENDKQLHAQLIALNEDDSIEEDDELDDDFGMGLS